jgi:hypothetical protein
MVPQILDDAFGYRLPSPPGVAVWWCEATYKVGRQRALPAETSATVKIEAARNEYEPFQIVLRPDTALSNLVVTVSDFVRLGDGPSARIAATNVEVCAVEYVPVAIPSDSMGVAGEWPDPLSPWLGAIVVPAGANQPLWFTVYVPKDAPAGDYEAAVSISAAGQPPVVVTAQLHVFNFALSDVTHTRTAYYADVHVDPKWHRLATLPDRRFVWDLYMQNYRRHRVSPYSAHLYAPITWQLQGGEFVVDFVAFDEAMSRYLDEFNFTDFNLFGHKSPPFPTSLGGHPAFTPSYQELFSQLMDKIMGHLREKGWAEKAYCYWMDEPTPDRYPHLLNGMDALQIAAPQLRRLVAWNNYPPDQYDLLLNGRVDIWTPIQNMATRPRFLDRGGMGEENWWYVCVGPMAPYPNLFIDHPAINHRIRFWAGEKYGISGDLYYAVNMWSGRNPWNETRTWNWSTANGDGVLLYPPTKTPPETPVLAPPINSIRWELTREALEDAEYFWLVKQHFTNALFRLGPGNPALGGAAAAREAALALVVNLTNYTKNPNQLYTARRGLAEAIETLDTGSPMIVKSPVAQAVALGETVSLYAEALGWPPPIYQWRLNGSDIVGATNSSLILSNCNSTHTGAYSVVAINAAGVATSSAAQVEGYWSATPRVIRHPTSLIRPEGGRAVFPITAVSKTPISYLWLHNGRPITSTFSSRPTLLLTNLSTTHSGDYSVIVSNVVGVVTSRVARLIVIGNYTPTWLIDINEKWRYHDAGVDLGVAWRPPGYNDSAWQCGPAPLGFGNGDEATVLASETDEKPITVYFRQAFEVAEALLDRPLTARLRLCAGAVVYLNGMEVFRYNLPQGEIGYDTPALVPVTSGHEAEFITFPLSGDLLHSGTNVLAVEVHQHTDTTGPVASWSLDEATPPWQDAAGGHDFTAVGTGVKSGPGRLNGCVTNSGAASSWLQTPDAPALRYAGPFTVGGWFAFGMATGNDPATTCLEKTGEFRLYYTGTAVNRYRFGVGGVEVQDQTSGTTSGQWRFVVAWYDGTNASIQVDNGPVYSTEAPPPTPTSNPLTALKRADGPGGFAADEIFFYPRVLSAGERTALYTTGLPVGMATNTATLAFDLELAAVVAQPPAFVEAPSNVMRREGENAAFRLTAASGTPVSYQWQFNGTPLLEATDTLLFLPEVTPAQAGLYALVASNLGGAVTSAPARLTVVSPPPLEIETLPTGNIALQWPSAEVAATLLRSTNLMDWEAVLTVPPGAPVPNWLITPEATVTQQFYRLRLDW